MLKCGAYMPVKLFPLRRKLHSAVIPREKRAAERIFQIFYYPCKVRLVIYKQLCRFGYVAVFCNIIEHPVIIAADIHVIPLCNIIIVSQIYVLCILHIFVKQL